MDSNTQKTVVPKLKITLNANFLRGTWPLVVVFWLVPCCVTGPPREGVARDPGPLVLRPALAVIRRHREAGTHLDGPRCPMYPSCAAYADTAIRRRSLLGFLLAVDRLFFREGPGLERRYLFAPPSFSEHLRLYDPFEDSDPLVDRRPSLLKEEFRPLENQP